MSQPATAAVSQRDNLLGVCHAMGEVFGINPLIIRLAFALCFILKFELALIAYAVCAAAVLTEQVMALSLRGRRDAKAG